MASFEELGKIMYFEGALEFERPLLLHFTCS